MSREEHPDGKEPIWGNPTLMECVGKGSFQLLGTGMVPPFYTINILIIGLKTINNQNGIFIPKYSCFAQNIVGKSRNSQVFPFALFYNV